MTPTEQLLGRCALIKPDGRPLYAYRCTDDEFAGLGSSLSATVGLLDRSMRTPREFCLYAAEWWRRNFKGGAWSWEPLLRSISAQYISLNDLYVVVIEGLRYWKRDLIRARHGRLFLLTLACEGGLPLGLIQREGTHLRGFFFSLLDIMKQYEGSGVAPR